MNKRVHSHGTQGKENLVQKKFTMELLTCFYQRHLFLEMIKGIKNPEETKRDIKVYNLHCLE